MATVDSGIETLFSDDSPCDLVGSPSACSGYDTEVQAADLQVEGVGPPNIQPYSGVLEKNVFITLNEETVDVGIAKNVCKLLNYLPQNMEAVEGMSLVGIIPSKALKSLARDKDFIDALRSLAYPKIAASIVRRMLN